MIISPLLQNWAKTVLAGPDNAPFCLVAVADLKGSAPREIGAVMLVYADHIKGSIGGGALEHQAIETAFSGFIKTGFKRQVRSYALGPSLGQCCGGTVRLMFEWYGPDGRSFVAPLLGDGASYSLHDLDGQKIPKICPRSGMPRSKTALALSLQHQTGQVFIYGAGHVGRAVIELARHLNCQLYWVDVDEDRYPHTIPPEVIKLPARTPEAIAARAPKDTIHLIMTYSHQLDYEIASALLSGGQFAKCGLIGSKTKAARFRKRLGETGLANAQLDRLICPIGLVEVKGKAPFQVALSVTAQLSGWLDELLKLAEQEANERFEEDPWVELVQQKLSAEAEVSIKEAIERCFGNIDAQSITTQMTRRMSLCLTLAGWQKDGRFTSGERRNQSRFVRGPEAGPIEPKKNFGAEF